MQFIDDLEEIKGNDTSLRCFTSRARFTKIGTRKFRTSCPFHRDRTPSFDVYLYGQVWIYKCLGCGVSGNVIQFVAANDGISFAEAVKRVKRETGFCGHRNMPRRRFRSVLPEKEKYETLPLQDYAMFERNLASDQAAKDWLLKARGITYETARRLQLGYRQSIMSRIPELQDVLNQGWIVFPSIEGDRVALVKYRSIARKAFARHPGMQTSLFNSQAIDSSEDLYATEGEFDCAVLAQAGFRAVSIGSTTAPITSKMISQMMVAKRVILAGDNDGGVGIKKMQELQTKIPSLLLLWPGCKDANELWLRDHNGDIEGFRKRVIGLVREAEEAPARS
jgi:DNA primase